MNDPKKTKKALLYYCGFCVEDTKNKIMCHDNTRGCLTTLEIHFQSSPFGARFSEGRARLLFGQARRGLALPSSKLAHPSEKLATLG